MGKALSMGKVSAVGGFQLFIGQSLSSIIMAIGSIILGRIMLPEEYGLYTIALVPSITLMLFQDWGIGVAMTKYIAHYRSINKEENIHEIVAVGMMFKLVTGLVLSIVSLLTSNFIAIVFFNRPEISPLVSIVSLAIISETMVRASKSSFSGFERMNLTSISLICQSILRSVIGPLLVLVGYGALGAVIGYTISFIVSAALAVSLLYFSLFKNLKNSSLPKTDKLKILKKMLRYGLPVSIPLILDGLLRQFYSFLMVFYCSDLLIGNYQVAVNFAIVLAFFSDPITTVLFPAFSKLEPKKEPELLKTVFKSSVKYTALLIIPATIATMVLAEPMVSTLFGDQYVYAPFFLTLYVAGYLFASLGLLTLGSFLSGIGETKPLMKLSFLTLVVGFVLSVLLIPPYNIVGVIMVIIFSSVPSLFIGLRWIWKHYEATVDWNSSMRIVLASSVAGAITYLFLSFFSSIQWFALIAGAFLFVCCYFVLAPCVGAIAKDDISNLKAMSSGLGFISRIAHLGLGFVEKIERYVSTRKS